MAVTSFRLKDILAVLLLAILIVLLFFMGLSGWSYLSFTRFIEIDQRDSLTLGREYERLMDRWAELSHLRWDAFLEAKPINRGAMDATLKNIEEIKNSLDLGCRGSPHEMQWLATKNVLADYTNGLRRFDDLLASWSSEISAREKEQGALARSFSSRVADLSRIIEDAQLILKDKNVQSDPSARSLSETVADLNVNLRTLKELFSTEEFTKLNQPEISRVETLIESRLNEFFKVFPNGSVASDSAIHASLRQAVDEIAQFAREFHLGQEDTRMRNHSLVVLEASIHLLNHHLRQLRNTGFEICLNESDLIWGEIEQDSKTLLGQIREKFYFRFLFLTLALLFAALGLILIPSAISGPLESLRLRFAQVTPGQVVPSVPSTRVREIDALEDSFGKMVSHINESTALQTHYFETLTRIQEVFSAIYLADNARGAAPSFPQQQAMAELFPLLSNEMKNLVLGQVFWQTRGEWTPCGPSHLLPISGSTPGQLPGDSSGAFFEKVFSEPGFTAWVRERAVVEPLVIRSGGGEIPGQELKLLPWSEIPTEFHGGVELSLAFLGVLLSPNKKTGEALPQSGFLLLGFQMTAPGGLSRADQIFISVIAQQMVALIEAVDLISAFRRDQAMAVQLQLAEGIQKKALPLEIPQSPFFDVQAVIRMANEVGGDFYEFFLLSDGNLGIWIADVSGKNVPAALLTMALKAALHSLPVETMTPKALVDRLNQILLDIVAGEHFVTMTYVLLEPANGRMTLCNAGHVPVLLFGGVPGGRAWKALEFADFPLGLFPNSYTQHALPINPGDRIILYTDGVTDCRDDSGSRFGEAGFRSLLDRIPEIPLESVLAAIDEFRGTAALPDDLTLLTVVFKTPRAV